MLLAGGVGGGSAEARDHVAEHLGKVLAIEFASLQQLELLLQFVAKLLAFALGIALSFAAVGLEELSFRRYPRMRDLVTLLGVAIAENVGYRQLSIYWRFRGMISKFRGAHSWGVMERKGFATEGTDSEGAS